MSAITEIISRKVNRFRFLFETFEEVLLNVLIVIERNIELSSICQQNKKDLQWYTLGKMRYKKRISFFLHKCISTAFQ